MTLLAAVITFTACSSDDDSSISNSIIGIWHTENDTRTEELQFLSDGTCYQELDITGSSARLRYTGSYSLEGNKLTIHWIKYQGWNPLTYSWLDVDADPQTEVITIKITGSTLTFVSMNGKTVNTPVVYTRR